MSRLTDLKNEQAAELLADLIEPAAAIFADTGVREALNDGKMAAIKYVMKSHSKELVDILAVIDGVPRDEYKVTPVQIIAKTLDILSDKELMQTFTSQEQTEAN